jgi:O-antigen/teichoic acid export membrane protein
MVLLTSIGCARFLGKSIFGQFGIVLGTANVVSAMATLGLGITATQYIAALRERDVERTGRIIGLTWTITAISGVIATIISVVTARPIAVMMIHAPELTNSIRIASAIVFVNAMLAYQNGALCGFEAFRGLARVNLISGLLSLPIVLMGVWRWGLNGAVTCTAISLVINWWLNERLLRNECRLAGIPIRIRQGFQETTVFWMFSLPALLGVLATTLVLWLCTVLVVRSHYGFEQMGLYAAADRWRLAILFIPTALFRAVLPMLANMHKQNPDGYRKVARAHLLINLIVILVPVMAIGCLSIPIMSIYGTGFRAGWTVLAVLCVSTIPEALNTILGFPLITGGKMWYRCGFDLALSAILLLLGIWLIPTYGAFGLAVAYLATYSIISAGLYIATRNQGIESDSRTAAAT